MSLTSIHITQRVRTNLPMSMPLSSMPNHVNSEKREVVTFLGLNNLSDNPNAIKTKRRVGRGIGSSKGKTCGRGHKGQKARSGGGPHPTFEGGQTTFTKRMPKRGFNNTAHATPMLPLNLGTLQDYIDMGRITPPTNPSSPPITLKDLVAAGIFKPSSIKFGVKLLAKGKERLKSKVRIDVSRVSKGAIQAVENLGGEVRSVHYNKLALRALLKPEKFEIIPRRARPPPSLMPYYTGYENRGYLSPEMQMRDLKRNISGEEKELQEE